MTVRRLALVIASSSHTRILQGSYKPVIYFD
jgi:hypothetical protein